MLDAYNGIMASISTLYADMKKQGIPTEDARYILPNATHTNLVVTMNARELLHFFSKRCCTRAQWEIRDLASRMLAKAKTVAPTIFEKAGAPCVRGKCGEGRFSCKIDK
jgi:thymidylate synthase (FAD)